MECQIYYDYILNMCYCLETEYYNFTLNIILNCQGIA